MKSRNILSDVERSPVGNDPLDLHFKNFYIKRLILKHFWWFQSKLNYFICINLITLREPIPVQSGESLKFAVAQFSWLHRCMLICFKWYTSYIYAQDLPNIHICICEWTVLYVQSLIQEYISYSCKLLCHLGPKLGGKRL